jgi:hypothetical protein
MAYLKFEKVAGVGDFPLEMGRRAAQGGGNDRIQHLGVAAAFEITTLFQVLHHLGNPSLIDSELYRAVRLECLGSVLVNAMERLIPP